MHHHDHGLGHGREESGQRIALRRRQLRGRKAEQRGEDHQREDRVVGRRLHDVRGHERPEPVTDAGDRDRCGTVAGGPGDERSGRLRIDRPQREYTERQQHGQRARQQQQDAEPGHRTPGQAAGRHGIGHSGDAGNEQREHQRAHGHAQGVEPDVADGLDDRRGVPQRAAVAGLQPRAERQAGQQAGEHDQAAPMGHRAWSGLSSPRATRTACSRNGSSAPCQRPRAPRRPTGVRVHPGCRARSGSCCVELLPAALRAEQAMPVGVVEVGVERQQGHGLLEPVEAEFAVDPAEHLECFRPR